MLTLKGYAEDVVTDINATTEWYYTHKVDGHERATLNELAYQLSKVDDFDVNGDNAEAALRAYLRDRMVSEAPRMAELLASALLKRAKA